MKNLLSCFVALCLLATVSGCAVLCQAGTGTCGMSKEQAAKLLYPKAYGEFWIKPGTPKEVWRQDWVDCGGMSNGSYGKDAPPGATTAEIFSASSQFLRKLDACMQGKGYVFQRS